MYVNIAFTTFHSVWHVSLFVGYSTDDNPPAVCGSENSYLSEITREDIERYTREQ